MKGLILMADNSCNKFRYRILNDNTFFFFFNDRNIAKNDNGSSQVWHTEFSLV